MEDRDFKENAVVLGNFRYKRRRKKWETNYNKMDKNRDGKGM